MLALTNGGTGSVPGVASVLEADIPFSDAVVTTLSVAFVRSTSDRQPTDIASSTTKRGLIV